MQATVELAQQIAGRLGQIEGVVAVALGGSWARGEAHPGSDVDLGIYYRNDHRPLIEALHRLAQELGYRYPTETVTDFGGWGPWINGGAWLQLEETPVDWLYRELGQVSRAIDECQAGRPAVHYQPGHPPPRLKLALIQGQLWEARFALDTCRKSAARGDTFYVSGCLFRCAACMVQALFALNERHLINEKGSVEATD